MYSLAHISSNHLGSLVAPRHDSCRRIRGMSRIRTCRRLRSCCRVRTCCQLRACWRAKTQSDSVDYQGVAIYIYISIKYTKYTNTIKITKL